MFDEISSVMFMFSVDEGDVLNVPAQGILTKEFVEPCEFTKVDERPVTPPDGGHLSLYHDGGFIYVPYRGTISDNFVCEISNGLRSKLVTVCINVQPGAETNELRNDRAYKTPVDMAGIWQFS